MRHHNHTALCHIAVLRKTFAPPRPAMDYIIDTFPIVKRRDEAKFTGDYRSKRIILEIYNVLDEAKRCKPSHKGIQ